MYTISVDGFPLMDARDDDLVVISPKVKAEVNTVGEASFTIYSSHPYYDHLQKLKSVFEVADEYGVIFRGRMTNDSLDFDKGKAVDLEGAMAYFNDSIVRPYAFPDDFLNNDDYVAAANGGNVVAFFLNWIIEQHNSQVQDFQRFKLGNVTVTDPNNYLSRSDATYPSTWEVLKKKLFDSALGGYLCIRYEKDGNYIDYLADFELTNTQSIVYGENLLDLCREVDASATYTACIPFGAELKDGSNSEAKKRLKIESIADGEIAPGIIKKGDALYSVDGVERYGWICAPASETTWDDVTLVSRLLTKAREWLEGDAQMLTDTVEISAVDLHFTDAEIRSFRIYRNIRVVSVPHDLSDVYKLTRIEYDLHNPQNTKITVGETTQTMTDINGQQKSEWQGIIESVEQEISKSKDETLSMVREEITTNNSSIVTDATEIIMSALENYVLTSDHEEFKRAVEAELAVLADEITMKFTTATEQIQEVDGDLQSKFNQVYKHISFSEDGIIIAGSGGLELALDDDMIVFRKNGVSFGWWDGVDFHTGNIIVDVNERAQFGNFAFVPRSDGSLSFLKVGGN